MSNLVLLFCNDRKSVFFPVITTVFSLWMLSRDISCPKRQEEKIIQKNKLINLLDIFSITSGKNRSTQLSTPIYDDNLEAITYSKIESVALVV